MSQNKLRETIDRMVEDAIRRILPNVMNEVLLRTLASAQAPLAESYARKPAYPYPPDGGGKRVKLVTQPKPKPQRRGKPDLSYLLDESAGSDFYSQYSRPDPEPVYEEPEEQEPIQERVARNIQNLPPEIQAMAEGLELDDDGGEMWEDESVTAIAPRGDDAGDLGQSSRRVGVDFSRMRALTQMTEAKKPKVSAEDRRAQAQFEELRIKRMRERLNGGKPV